MRDTQRESWDALQAKLPVHRGAVLAMIRERRQITTQGLSDALKWPINCVSGRVTELADAGFIRDSGKRAINPISGRRAIVWEINDIPRQQELFDGRAA